MHPPEDLDALLRHMHEISSPVDKPANAPAWYSSGDQATLRNMVRDAAMENKAIGVFMVLHEDRRLEYMIVRGTRTQAIGIAADFVNRQVDVQKNEQ